MIVYIQHIRLTRLYHLLKMDFLNYNISKIIFINRSTERSQFSLYALVMKSREK